MWIKDADSDPPRIIYTAPEDLSPMIQVVYDPDMPEAPWCVRYSYLSTPAETLDDIEELMGL